MKKLTASVIFFCLLSASTPAVTHAIAHALASSLEHSHDGGADFHLHHGEAHHNSELSLLPPALTRRGHADAPGADTSAAASCSAARPDRLPLFLFSSLLGGDFVPVLLAGFIPQLASIPPPAHT